MEVKEKKEKKKREKKILARKNKHTELFTTSQPK